MAKTTYVKRNIKYRNYLMNGDMALAQRGTSFAAVNAGTYVLDRMRYDKVGATVHTVSQDTDVPTLAQSGYNFTNSYRFNLTTPDTSIATGDYALMQQRIEGFNYANFAQRQFTLSFWVKATLPGTYCCFFKNSGSDRSYVVEYTINASATWEYKTITVSANDGSGSWNYTNGIGLDIGWTIAAGATFQTTANSWNNGLFLATSNQINGVNTGATDFRLTGLMLNEGSEALPFRLFSDGGTTDLAVCERYYEKSYDVGTAVPTATANGQRACTNNNTASVFTIPISVGYKTPKRTGSPTVTIYNPVTNATGSARGSDSVNYTATSTNIGMEGFRVDVVSLGANGVIAGIHFTSDAEL